MRRIANDTATVDNKFTNGNAALGVPATDVDDVWLNTIQEELAALVEYGGGELDPEDDGQVLAKILEMVSAGGGGGGSAVWNADAGDAPIVTNENGERVFLFEKAGDNKAYLYLRVPRGYIDGRQVKAYLSAYSPSVSNGFLLKTKTYLIRKNVDGVDAGGNFHVSTNLILTNTAANQYREVQVDLTDATGQINAVGIQGGDLLRIELFRDTDTDTAEVRFIPSATEITFG